MTRLAVASIAAVVASIGDLLMLAVANTGRPELRLAAVPPVVLWVGALLGVVAIPFYALGYGHAARLIAQPFPGYARVVAGAGSLGALLGAVIHGYTALFVRDALASGAPAGDPLAAIGNAPPLAAAWALATLLIVAASVAFALAVRHGVPGVPRALALAIPAVVTVAIALVGGATLLGRAFLVPAAPNLAHVVFFAACARATQRGSTARTDPRGG